MTAFVVLAAGRGTRMGRYGVLLHKALLPLDGRAVISHQISLAPADARVIVCTGYRAGQVRDYLELAHPGREITFVPVEGWNQPGGGPGASLLAARDAAGDDDLIFTPCDTLWSPDETLWDTRQSWAGVAPVPEGTAPERWCRISSSGGNAEAIRDKTPGLPSGDAYTGLAMILRQDLQAFWDGIRPVPGECQVSGGLEALLGRLAVQRITWTDTGDEAAYARAVTAWSGYDWAKPGEATWVLPERVVKFRASGVTGLGQRQAVIAAAAPELAGTRPQMLAYKYVPGVTGYEAAENDEGLVPRLLDWAAGNLWHPVQVPDTAAACERFYKDKTHARVAMLPPGLREIAGHAVSRVDWDELTHGCVPVTFHGDFILDNVIVGPDGGFTAIDWREDFAGETSWGDWRYDLAKLAAGTIMHFGNARRGDFRPWPAGEAHRARLAGWLGGTIPHDVMVIAGLMFLNSAPLHTPPLGEIMTERGTALLAGL